MAKQCLAVDIGASSGRVVAGQLENGKLHLEEIHRFQNHLVQKNNQLIWDIDHLFSEIKTGIHKSIQAGMDPQSIGIDTWAVDFVLLDENNERLTDAVAYRDSRTDGMMEAVFEKISKEKIYEETGIQFQKFNTIFQLYALKQMNPEVLEKAKTFLMIPDYLNFLLTGKMANEYTNATTTQLMTANSKEWNQEFLHTLGIPETMFQQVKLPGESLGSLSEELQKEFGCNFEVVLPATHDTGSAVAAVPEQEKTIYISSGTWSLMGVENDVAISNQQAFAHNLTNEGGVNHTFRFLKNIMGMWMIQEVKRLYKDQYSFAEFVELAEAAADFNSVVDAGSDRYLMPENMIEEIQKECKETNQPIPTTPGEIAKCIYLSLAKCYQSTVEEIEEITGEQYAKINVIGGGCQNNYLNQLIANFTNKDVYAGPVEATAIGNIIMQMIANKQLTDVQQAREMIKQSFDIHMFKPTK